MTVTVYNADPVIALYAKTGDDMPALTRRYKALTAQKRFRAAFPQYGTVTLKPGRGGGSWADFGAREIRLGSNRHEAVLLHEIAHHVARRHAQYGYCPDHGPGFASAFLDVVKVALGAEAERALRHLYRALRIRVYKPGSPKGVLPRAPGDAPERARAAIERIVSSRSAAKSERAMLRDMIASLPDPTETGKYEMPCPACGQPATLDVHFYGWGRAPGLNYHGSCDNRFESGAPCHFSEYQRVAGKAYRALREKHRKAA